MQATDVPTRHTLVFAENAGIYTVTIPQTTAAVGRASYSIGFPPDTFIPEESGGLPPDGRDMNGILFDLSAWTQWAAAGGTTDFSSAFANDSNIGGYPKGAILRAKTVQGGTVSNALWLSLVDNNTVDPDAGVSANWQLIQLGHVYAGDPNTHVAGIAVADGGLSPAMLWDTVNKIFWVCTTSGNAANAVWTAMSIAPPIAGGFTGTATFATVTVANGLVTNAVAGAAATSSTLGIVRPDNSTITVSNGILTAVSGMAGTVTNVGSGDYLTGGPITVSGTLSGVQAAANEIQRASNVRKIVDPQQLGAAAGFGVLTDAASVAWDTNVQGFNVTLTRNTGTAVIAAPANAKLGWPYMMVITAGANNLTTTFDACFDWGFMSTPVLSKVAGKVDVIHMFCYSLSPLKFRASYHLAAP